MWLNSNPFKYIKINIYLYIIYICKACLQSFNVQPHETSFQKYVLVTHTLKPLIIDLQGPSWRSKPAALPKKTQPPTLINSFSQICGTRT